MNISEDITDFTECLVTKLQARSNPKLRVVKQNSIATYLYIIKMFENVLVALKNKKTCFYKNLDRFNVAVQSYLDDGVMKKIATEMIIKMTSAELRDLQISDEMYEGLVELTKLLFLGYKTINDLFIFEYVH